METLNCPRCGSGDLNQSGTAEYRCPQCGTGFTLIQTQAQVSFVDVVLVEAGKKKTNVTMALREITAKEPTLELMDLATASRLPKATPCVVAPNVSLEVGERIKASLEKAGATVQLKPA